MITKQDIEARTYELLRQGNILAKTAIYIADVKIIWKKKMRALGEGRMETIGP